MQTIKGENIPWLTTDEMIEVDRIMIEELKISLVQMMENAGRNLALLTHHLIKGSVRGKKIVVLAGAGGNGGGAMVAARHLHNAGGIISVFISKPANQFNGVPAHQLDILQRMTIPVFDSGFPQEADIVLDGLIGYSLQGNPRGRIKDLIAHVNKFKSLRISLDVPSGLQATTGKIGNPCILADATLTLALPKEGLRQTASKSQIGRLFLGDISVPPAVYHQMNLGEVTIFDGSNYVVEIV